MLKIKYYCCRHQPGSYPKGHDIHTATSIGQSIAHGAALALRGDQLLAVGQQLTLDIITHSHTIVAHTYAAWLWFPNVIVLVDQAVNSAVLVTNWLNFRGVGAKGGQKRGLFKEKNKQVGYKHIASTAC